jgi:hypothetical protein
MKRHLERCGDGQGSVWGETSSNWRLVLPPYQDPFLVSAMGAAMIEGQQGAPALSPLDTPSTYIEGTVNIANEAKHAIAYGYGGRDWYRVDVNGATLTVSHLLCSCSRSPAPPLVTLSTLTPSGVPLRVLQTARSWTCTRGLGRRRSQRRVCAASW